MWLLLVELLVQDCLLLACLQLQAEVRLRVCLLLQVEVRLQVYLLL